MKFFEFLVIIYGLFKLVEILTKVDEKTLKEIEDAKNKSWEDSDKMYQDTHRRIEKERMEIHSIMDSRFNKMENKFISYDLKDLSNPVIGGNKNK